MEMNRGVSYSHSLSMKTLRVTGAVLLLVAVSIDGLCCGRKKRSMSEFTDFHNLAAQSTDALCNSPDLMRVLRNHMSNSTNVSLSSITASLESAGERFVILCSPPQPILFYAVPHQTEFCSVTSSDHSCHIFADPRHVSDY